jgi:two-component system OmpR family sensor kinase
VTLRLRLVLGLMALLAVGLVAFGVATYSFYAHSQYQGLDAQLHGSSETMATFLAEQAGVGPGSARLAGNPGGPGPFPLDGAGNGPSHLILPPGDTCAELRNAAGDVLYHYGTCGNGTLPKLQSKLPAARPGGRYLTVGATTGSSTFRLLVMTVNEPPGGCVILAASTSGVVGSLHRLLLIEVLGGILLLVALCLGAWLVLRGELHPLERMARSARSITTGDLSQRVSTAGPPEVGQLGLALNTMLGDIEVAFRDREATERRLRQFLADASHELRTPLTSIQGFAELFRVGGEAARVDLPTILRRIEQESARMGDLVEDLLLLARLDEARPIERRPVDLAVLAADACSDLSVLAHERPVALDAPEPVLVEGDHQHLRQALANLTINAVRHTPAGTPIEVSARAVGGAAVVSVRDHGPGLTDDALAHVFDRFWQADHARVGTSAGLGLAIVAGIASEHGGRAQAVNAPGGGAIFSLRLPLGRPAP